MYQDNSTLREKKYIEFFGKELFNVTIDVFAFFQPDCGYPEGFSSDYPFYHLTGQRNGDKYYHIYTFYVTKKDNIVVHTEFFHDEPTEDYPRSTLENEKKYIYYDSASDVKSYTSLNEILADINDLPIQYRVELDMFFDSKIETEVWDI